MPTPAPVYALSDLVRIMNAPERAGSAAYRWDHRKVRRMIEAGGVRFIQARPRCKLYVALTQLREAFPDLVGSMLLAEHPDEE